MMLAACGPGTRGANRPGEWARLSRGDAPWELAEDSDLAWVRLEYDALEQSAPERTAKRRELADEYAHRIDARFAEGRRAEAHQAMLDLVSLWSPRELASGSASRELAAYRPGIEKVREAFSRAGGERETVGAIAVLIVIAPARAAELQAELGDIFAYADDLAVAQFGEGAQRARPIELLESVRDSFPSPFVVDRLVELYIERQGAVESLFKRDGANFQILRAHGPGVLKTAWNITRTYARARRLPEATAKLASLTGFGDDTELRKRLRAAIAPDASAAAWLELAASFRGNGDPDESDSVAAFAIQLEATERFPQSAEAWFAAAETAADLGSVPLATWMFEKGLSLSPANRQATESLASLYERHVSMFAQSDRLHAAQRALEHFEKFFAASARRWKQPIEPDLADVYATMGRGLLSQGEIERARAMLSRSVELRPTLPALDSLGTLELKLDNFQAAIPYFREALELPSQDLGFQFNRNKVLRSMGEAHEGAGDAPAARRYYQEAMRAWNDLAMKAELKNPYLAEALVESAKLEWRLGRRSEALARFDDAIDLDPDGASTHADVVSFLVVRGEYDSALDAFHRALGNREISEYFKVYMSLWMIGEARQSGRTEDRLALAYLHARDGRLWYDQLARFASGRANAQALQARATTRARRAELLYYSAVLGDDPFKMRSLLERVVESGMILFFEYDMAKLWLEKKSAMSKP